MSLLRCMRSILKSRRQAFGWQFPISVAEGRGGGIPRGRGLPPPYSQKHYAVPGRAAWGVPSAGLRGSSQAGAGGRPGGGSALGKAPLPPPGLAGLP